MLRLATNLLAIKNLTTACVVAVQPVSTTTVTRRGVHSRHLQDNVVPTTNEEAVPRILITGSLGQIGSELVALLRAKYGRENVIASDIKRPPSKKFLDEGPFVYANAVEYETLARVVVEHKIDWLIHNSSILSASGEMNPQLALEVNVKGFQNALEIARQHKLRILAPSTIAVFGPETPKDNTPDVTIMRPTTVYGVSKVYLELLGEYYYRRYGVDFRSLRYPGVISAETVPGGGTTDYAVEIFYYALRNQRYDCFLKEDAALPMMYMADCLKATLLLLEAPQDSLTQRTYNVHGCSFTPQELFETIKQHLTDFQIAYKPDFRQKIAESWPHSLDDAPARRDWGWRPDHDIHSITKDMIEKLRKRLK